MRPTPLPPQLAAGPFRTRASGVTRARMRASDLDASIRGVRLAHSGPLTLRDRCAMFQLRVRDDAVFSHATAALLLGAPLPLARERDPVLHVTVPAPAPTPRGRGLRGHSAALESGDVTVSAGIPHTSGERTWLDLATVLPLDDLVAVGDYLIHWRSPITTRESLLEHLERMPGRRGLRRARAAVKLLSDRPESRRESLLRLVVLRAGLPEPRINHTIIDSETGRESRPDFTFPNQMVIIEYQGDYHRTREQWRKDMTRRSRLEAQGWYVMEVNADDLRDPDELVARIRMVLARRS